MFIRKLWLSLLFMLCTFKTFNVFAVVSSFGDKCTHTAECADHRMVCEPVSKINDTKICICDRFHRWNGTSLGCVQNFSIEEILELLEEKANVASHIQMEADFIFYAQILAGLLVLAVGSTCSIIILIFCYYIKIKDRKLKATIERLQYLNNERKAAKQTTSASAGIT